MLSTGIKPYPCSRLTHGAIDCALALRDALPDGPAADAIVDLALNPLDNGIVAEGGENKVAPGNTVEGQFSVYSHTAAALLRGRPDWSVYRHISDADIRDLARRVTPAVTDDVPTFTKLAMIRTSRRLMAGTAYVPVDDRPATRATAGTGADGVVHEGA